MIEGRQRLGLASGSSSGIEGPFRSFDESQVAIIDDTPVKHTRPVGGPNYAFSAKAGLAPAHEDWLVSASHFIDIPADWQINHAGLLTRLHGHTRAEADAMLRALLESCSGLKVSALQLTRSLSNHFTYWAGGESGHPRYPRAAARGAEPGVAALRHPLPEAGRADGRCQRRRDRQAQARVRLIHDLKHHDAPPRPLLRLGHARPLLAIRRHAQPGRAARRYSDHPIFEKLLTARRPRRILEVGTLFGASVVHMARIAQRLDL